jgi:hypothetical protein
MSTNIVYNGVTYTIPAYDDVEWGKAVSAYLIAIPAGMLTKAGGSWHLTDSDLDLGSAYGLATIYLKSKTSNIAQSGVVRLAKTDFIAWRNNANGGDNKLATDTDLLTWNLVEIPTISSTSILTNKTFNAPDNTLTGIADINIDAAAAIALSKILIGPGEIQYESLSLTGKLKDADWSSDPADKLSAAKIDSDFGPSSVITAGTFKVGDNPYVSVKANALADYDFELPAADGVAGQALVKSVAGTLEWASIPGLSLQQYYVMVGDSSNLPTSVNTSAVGDIGANETTGFTIKALAVDNSHIKAAAAIALTKLAALATGSRALASDATGFIVESATTAAELGYLSGVTSAVQTQLNTTSSAISNKLDITSLVPFTVSNAPNSSTVGTASKINTINPDTVGLIIKGSYDAGALPANISFLAPYGASPDALFSLGSPTGTLVGNASVSGGKLDCSVSTSSARYDGAGNADFAQAGTIRVLVTPGYTGNPAALSCIFVVRKTLAAGETPSMMALFHHNVSGYLYLYVQNDAGVAQITAADTPVVWAPVSGTTYEIEVDYNFTAGATRIFINGVQHGPTITPTFTRSAGDMLYFILSSYDGTSLYWGNYLFDNMAIFSTVQHIADFTGELPHTYGEQNVDSFQVQNSSGTPLFSINGAGIVTLKSAVFTDITASSVPYVDANKKLTASTTTIAELTYLTGVTSAIQTQLNAKAPSSTAVTLTGVQALTNKDIDGGTASNTSRITIPKNTSANLTGLTRKQGTILYDTDAQKLKIDDGTSLKVVGGGLIPVPITKTYATVLESGKHYLLDAVTAAADITLNLPAGSTEADIKITSFNIPTGYKVIIAPNGAEKIFYDDTDCDTVTFEYAETEQWIELCWNGTKWIVNDGSGVLSGTFNGSLDFTGDVSVAGSLDINASDTSGNVRSGTYSATVTAVGGCTVTSPKTGNYIRVGNLVTVSVVIDVDPTTAGAETNFTISLPIASDLTNINQLAGVCASYEGSGCNGGVIWGNTANNVADVYIFPVTNVNHSYTVHFTYVIA